MYRRSPSCHLNVWLISLVSKVSQLRPVSNILPNLSDEESCTASNRRPFCPAGHGSCSSRFSSWTEGWRIVTTIINKPRPQNATIMKATRDAHSLEGTPE
ncbi:hypothetical protein B0J17DRAFT_681369 [Rhizoctonia solani]|nr:hypothetical protein B0J17DRAFT_681369 [Rhizoctonia solani]